MYATTEGEEGDGEAVDENRGEDDEIGDGLDDESESVESVLGRNGGSRELGGGESRLLGVIASYRQLGLARRRTSPSSALRTHNEDGSDSHGSEMTSKQRLPLRLDVGNPPLQRIDGGQATEEEDAAREEDEAPYGEREHLVLPRAEGHSGAEVDENGAVGE